MGSLYDFERGSLAGFREGDFKWVFVELSVYIVCVENAIMAEDILFEAILRVGRKEEEAGFVRNQTR